MLLRFLSTAALAASLATAQSALSVRWEDLTASDFVKAIQASKGVCLLPFGILEKHGPQLPLGTDLIDVRYASLDGARQEYAVVFPEYYFGQIFEARHEPGTIAYSARLQLDLLTETTSEMARNGCKKIIVVNGHGGNNSLLPYFAQSQMASAHDYVVYVYQGERPAPGRPARPATLASPAGASATAHGMIAPPDLVHLDRAPSESGADLQRLDLPPGMYTGIWWYAKFADHYAGDATAANTTLGKFDMDAWAKGIANAIRAAKSDTVSLRLQNEFFEKATHPLDTKQ